jgi:hypothetical protein
MARAVAAAALALAGCVVHVDYSHTMFRCDDGSCPSGFSCGVDRICHADGVDFSVADLASVSDLASCGASSSVVDNFDNNMVASFWIATGASEVGGQAVVALPSPAPAGASGEFQTRARTDLRNSYVFIAVIQTTNTSSQAETFLRVSDGSNMLAVVQKNGMLSFRDGATSLATITYDNVMHRWWRIHQQGSSILFETSLDGSSWTMRATEATPPWIDSVTIEFGADTVSAEPSPGTAHFDNLNGGGQPMGPSC